MRLPPVVLPTLPLPEGSGTRSGLASNMTHTAVMTSFTPAGGAFIAFKFVMSLGDSVSSAFLPKLMRVCAPSVPACLVTCLV